MFINLTFRFSNAKPLMDSCFHLHWELACLANMKLQWMRNQTHTDRFQTRNLVFSRMRFSTSVTEWSNYKSFRNHFPLIIYRSLTVNYSQLFDSLFVLIVHANKRKKKRENVILHTSLKSLQNVDVRYYRSFIAFCYRHCQSTSTVPTSCHY